jgi:hypothetical protein
MSTRFSQLTIQLISSGEQTALSIEHAERW